MAGRTVSSYFGNFTFSYGRTISEFEFGTDLKSFWGAITAPSYTSPEELPDGVFPIPQLSAPESWSPLSCLIVPKAFTNTGICLSLKPSKNGEILVRLLIVYKIGYEFYTDYINVTQHPEYLTSDYKWYISEFPETATSTRLTLAVFSVSTSTIVASVFIRFSTDTFNELIDQFYLIPDTPTSPEFPGDTSTGGGGEGNFDGTGDSNPAPDVPPVTIVDTGMVTFWAPSSEELSQVADYLTTEVGDVIDFSKWGVTPFDNIISLFMLPITAPLGLIREWKLPNALIPTNIRMPLLSGQWFKVDCGTINVQEYWGSALDYSPYTRISIFLPFIGVQSLITDEVMGGGIHPVYTINMCTGEAVCSLEITKGGKSNVLYSYPCNVSSNVPITASDASNIRAALATTAISTVAALAVPSIAASGISMAVPTSVNEIGSIFTSATLAGKAAASARDVISSKADVMRSGSLSGGSGFMAGLTPYLIITRPKQSLPENYNVYRGYPSNMTMQLGTLSGFTTVSSVHIDNIAAYPEEIQAIESALAGGVIF